MKYLYLFEKFNETKRNAKNCLNTDEGEGEDEG